jgi:hypothetical protein
MKIIRDPLFHFLLLGATIFAAHAFVTRHKTDKPGEIVLTRGTVDNLVTGFTRTWQRPPMEEELQGLMRDYLREEVAYREALALGLDRNDMIVRRRLQQKLEFLSDDLATRKEPSQQELQTFLQAHSNLFRTEPRFTLQQVYFNPQLHLGSLQHDIVRTQQELQASGRRINPENLGDPFLLQQRFENVPLSDLKNTFGEKFATALPSLPVATWQGPIESGYGDHLLYITERTEGRLPALSEVRDQVRREWLEAKRKEALDKFYQALLSRYTINIEPSEEKKLAQVR